MAGVCALLFLSHSMDVGGCFCIGPMKGYVELRWRWLKHFFLSGMENTFGDGG